MTLPRPHIPIKLQRDVALIQLGLDPKTAELDHDPALGLRDRTPGGGYFPDANDPNHLKWRDPAGHAKKTRGVKATTAGSDVHLIAKGKRLRRSEAEGSNRLLAKYGVTLTATMSPELAASLQRPRRKAKIASRGFDKSKTRTFAGKVRPRKARRQ